MQTGVNNPTMYTKIELLNMINFSRDLCCCVYFFMFGNICLRLPIEFYLKNHKKWDVVYPFICLSVCHWITQQLLMDYGSN